jgi:hypothetical protein
MANFAIVVDGVVENCIIADSIEIAQEITGKLCVGYEQTDSVSVGFTYSDGVFTNPNPPTLVEEGSADLVPPIEE